MIVRGLEETDLQLRVSWMNNEKVYSSMHFDIPVIMENTLKWYHDNLGNDKRTDLTFEENEEIVAFGGLTCINREVSKAELYIFVNPNAQKSGIGTKAVMLLCKYGFEEIGLNKIYLETNENNMAARRVYEKCGFMLEGVHREEYKTAGGVMLSRMYYGLLKRDFNG